jgi:hypothetical protein
MIALDMYFVKTDSPAHLLFRICVGPIERGSDHVELASISDILRNQHLGLAF